MPSLTGLVRSRRRRPGPAGPCNRRETISSIASRSATNEGSASKQATKSMSDSRAWWAAAGRSAPRGGCGRLVATALGTPARRARLQRCPRRAPTAAPSGACRARERAGSRSRRGSGGTRSRPVRPGTSLRQVERLTEQPEPDGQCVLRVVDARPELVGLAQVRGIAPLGQERDLDVERRVDELAERALGGLPTGVGPRRTTARRPRSRSARASSRDRASTRCRASRRFP